MAIIEDGVGASKQLEISTFGAANVSAMPMVADHYAYGGFTGILPAALAANPEIFQFRNSHGSKLMVVQKVIISASVSTTFFAAGVPIQIDLVRAAAWSGQGTGSTAINPSTFGRKRTDMAASGMASGDIRIAATATLGIGTKTLESIAMASLLAAAPITASLNGVIIPPNTVLFEANVTNGEHPIVLAQNEGLVIRSVAVPATGTWQAAIKIEWAEVSAY